jgi:hypothetical protein
MNLHSFTGEFSMDEVYAARRASRSEPDPIGLWEIWLSQPPGCEPVLLWWRFGTDFGTACRAMLGHNTGFDIRRLTFNGWFLWPNREYACRQI